MRVCQPSAPCVSSSLFRSITPDVCRPVSGGIASRRPGYIISAVERTGQDGQKTDPGLAVVPETASDMGDPTRPLSGVGKESRVPWDTSGRSFQKEDAENQSEV